MIIRPKSPVSAFCTYTQATSEMPRLPVGFRCHPRAAVRSIKWRDGCHDFDGGFNSALCSLNETASDPRHSKNQRRFELPRTSETRLHWLSKLQQLIGNVQQAGRMPADSRTDLTSSIQEWPTVLYNYAHRLIHGMPDTVDGQRRVQSL